MHALPRLRPLWVLAVLYLLLPGALRLALWLRFGLEAGVGAAQLPAVLALGTVNDAVELLYLLAPFALYLALLPQRWYATAAQRALLAVATYAVLFGMLFLGPLEYFFF